MIPPGGQTVMKPQGTNRFTPVFFAALARGIWSCCSAGPTQLITTSMPANASMSCSSGAFKSHFRIWHPRSWRRVIAGFWAEIGRTRAMTSCVAKNEAISLGSIGSSWRKLLQSYRYPTVRWRWNLRFHPLLQRAKPWWT